MLLVKHTNQQLVVLLPIVSVPIVVKHVPMVKYKQKIVRQLPIVYVLKRLAFVLMVFLQQETTVRHMEMKFARHVRMGIINLVAPARDVNLFVVPEQEKRLFVLRPQIVFVLKMYVRVPTV